eukprot:SAG11_NODE_728_length_7495_cov_3.384397_5_plen_190_part_00
MRKEQLGGQLNLAARVGITFQIESVSLTRLNTPRPGRYAESLCINATTGIFIALAHERVAMCKQADELTRRRATASAIEHAARTCENQELPNGAMGQASALGATGLANGSEHNRWAHSIANRCRGRLLAADGQVDAAAEALEAGALAARLHGYNYLESLALAELMAHAPRLALPAHRARHQVLQTQLAQ